MRLRRWLAAAALLGGLGFAGQAGWIQAKATIAQWLVQRSWTATVQSGEARPPWPGSDTWPVARLLVPDLGVDQFVLAGDSGRTLAFGPGWAPASAMPGTRGLSVVSGHRDTHFRWLRGLAPGQLLVLQTPAGSRHYRVEWIRTADADSQQLALGGTRPRLALVTCWPFDALATGGPERLLVMAVEIGTAVADQPTADATAERIRAITSA